MSVPLAEDVEKLCKLMQKYGLTELEWSGLTLRRHPSVTQAEYVSKLEKKRPATDEEPDDLARIRAMTPEQQDAALTLAHTRET